MFSHSDYDQHECVVSVNDRASGLRAIIAIHSTTRGPSFGGCRLWGYEKPEQALTDALRLSRGMSYKNAMADLPIGGGKAVMLGPVPEKLREAQFRALGRAIEQLNGRYITAEDVGVKVADVRHIASATQYVSGLESPANGVGGDPSPFTARGVLRGIEAISKTVWQRSDLEGLAIAVQGLGGVGGNLCRLLDAKGAKLIVCDVDPRRVSEIVEKFGAEAVSVNEIHAIESDIFAPCALGGGLNETTVGEIGAKAIAGGANNQLQTPDVGLQLAKRGVAFAPDYVINAGGIIAVTDEYFGNSNQFATHMKIDAIYDRTLDILQESERTQTPPNLVADRRARALINTAEKPAREQVRATRLEAPVL